MSSWATISGVAPFCGPKTAEAPCSPYNGLETSEAMAISQSAKPGWTPDKSILASISDNIKNLLTDDKYEAEIYKTLKDRPAQFILYLMFKDSSVSMQDIADTYFLSKTIVAKEFETIKRWLQRSKGLKLLVTTHGCKILGDERDKRIYISNLITFDLLKQLPLENDFSVVYKLYIESISKLLTKIVIENMLVISDGDFNRICRYIVTSMIRSQTGYIIEEDSSFQKDHIILTSLFNKVKDATGFELSKRECSEIIQLLNVFNRDANNVTDQKTLTCVQETLIEINNLFAVKDLPPKSEIEKLSKSIEILKNKQKQGITTLNSLNNEIVKSNLY